MINFLQKQRFDKIFAVEKPREKVLPPPSLGEFRIQFPLQKFYENYIISTPFSISVRGLSSSIEDRLAKKYPELLTATFYDDRLLEMSRALQKEVREGLTDKDKKQIQSIFYSRRWLTPFLQYYERFFEFELTDFKLIMWQEKPQLRINGIIHCDFTRLLSVYYKNFVTTNAKNDFLKQTFRINFTRNFPTLFTYFKDVELRKMILEIIEKDVKTLTKRKLIVIPRILPWTQLLVKILGRVETYEKRVSWVSPTTISIRIDDYYRKLVDKIKSNPGKIIVGGAIAYNKLLRDRNKNVR